MLTRTFALACLAVCLSAGNLSAQENSHANKPSFHLPTVNMHGVLTTGTYQPALGSFDETILKYMADYHIPGASIAIVKEGQLIYARGYGYANVEEKTLATPLSQSYQGRYFAIPRAKSHGCG